MNYRCRYISDECACTGVCMSISPCVGGIGHTRDGDKRKVSVYVGLCLYHGVGVSNDMGLVVIRLASDQRAINDQRHVKPPSQMKQNHTALGRAG